jgi:RNA polymerase sigma-70 factor (ECF subfamily)
MATHLADEATLVTAARMGSHEAFSILINQYQRNIYGLAFRFTGNREDAEDTLQEALLKAYCNLKQFQGNSRFYTWLVRIAVNEALMKIRKRRTDRFRQVSLDELTQFHGVQLPREIEDTSDNPEKHCAKLEFQELLARTLSPRLGQALLLRNAENFSVKETAKILGLSVSAVKSRLARARSRLRQKVKTVFLTRANSQAA